MKGDLAAKEAEYTTAYTEFQTILLTIPSPALADVPVGSEHDNQVIKKIGEQVSFDFAPKTHWELLEAK
jgi:seryl-tRNA synthetase